MTRALLGCLYVAAPSVRVQVRRTTGSHVWLELVIRGRPTGRMTKLHREVFEELFTREGGAAHPPAPVPQGGRCLRCGWYSSDITAHVCRDVDGRPLPP